MYDNGLLKRMTTLMSGAGYFIKGFSHKGEKGVTLKLLPLCQCQEEAEYEEERNPAVYSFNGEGERNVEETCDLVRFLGAEDWRHAFSLVQEVIRADSSSALNVGDFIWVKFDVPATERQGVKFKSLSVNAKVIIVEADSSKVIFGFDEILFLSPINTRDKNDGGFSAAPLAEYLHNEFSDAMGISDVLLPNHEGNDISLFTATEIFGEEEYWKPSSNWDEDPLQLCYFRKIKNRIKVWDDDTHWWWTSSLSASSASNFCRVNINGNSFTNQASAVGGVAPAFCVA